MEWKKAKAKLRFVLISFKLKIKKCLRLPTFLFAQNMAVFKITVYMYLALIMLFVKACTRYRLSAVAVKLVNREFSLLFIFYEINYREMNGQTGIIMSIKLSNRCQTPLISDTLYLLLAEFVQLYIQQNTKGGNHCKESKYYKQ